MWFTQITGKQFPSRSTVYASCLMLEPSRCLWMPSVALLISKDWGGRKKCTSVLNWDSFDLFYFACSFFLSTWQLSFLNNVKIWAKFYSLVTFNRMCVLAFGLCDMTFSILIVIKSSIPFLGKCYYTVITILNAMICYKEGLVEASVYLAEDRQTNSVPQASHSVILIICMSLIEQTTLRPNFSPLSRAIPAFKF